MAKGSKRARAEPVEAENDATAAVQTAAKRSRGNARQAERAVEQDIANADPALNDRRQVMADVARR